MDVEEARKALRIKAGVVSRLGKELEAYRQEEARDKAKLEQLQQDGSDSADVKHQQSVAEESAMMVPDTRRRLSSALTELQQLVHDYSADDYLSNSQELSNAREALSLHQLPENANDHGSGPKAA
jgi:tubulin-specific chaperone A